MEVAATLATSYSPYPGRKRTRRSWFRKKVWPFLTLAAVLALLGTTGYLVVGKIARPFRLCNREQAETRRLEAELEALRKENARLERAIRYLHTSEGISNAARKLGWVRPGEIMLVLPAEQNREPSH